MQGLAYIPVLETLQATQNELIGYGNVDVINADYRRNGAHVKATDFPGIGVTITQATPQLEQLAEKGIITQQSCLDQNRMYYFTIEISKNPSVAPLIERQCALCRKHFGE